MEFNHGLELLQLCEATGLPISQIMKKEKQSFLEFQRKRLIRKWRRHWRL